eukprot:m.12625 g.12625  ORF g.12625 m.12625 type:complete len:65 (-) comp3247_c1_seq1:8-202(-)
MGQSPSLIFRFFQSRRACGQRCRVHCQRFVLLLKLCRQRPEHVTSFFLSLPLDRNLHQKHEAQS